MSRGNGLKRSLPLPFVIQFRGSFGAIVTLISCSKIVILIWTTRTFLFMNDKTEALQRLDTAKLMDVVKNYRQYGYDEAIRDSALLILEKRGIEIEEMALSGSLHNASYDNAERVYRSYVRNSNLAFLSYILIFAFNIGGAILADPGTRSTLSLMLFVAALILYFRFLIGSFIDQSNFFRSLGKKWNGSDQVIYFLVGMPFYILMYFFYRNQMREEMKMIR